MQKQQEAHQKAEQGDRHKTMDVQLEQQKNLSDGLIKAREVEDKKEDNRFDKQIKAIQVQLDAMLKMIELNVKEKDVTNKYKQKVKQLNN